MGAKVLMAKITPTDLGPDVFKLEVWDPAYSVGGGPIFPDTKPPEGKPPRPGFPIVIPPDQGGGFPDKPGYPDWIWGAPIIPPPGEPEPPTDPRGKWVPTTKGWIFVAGPFDKPRPINGGEPAA